MPADGTKNGKSREEARERFRVGLGRALDRFGQLCLPLGLGLFLGYWISDLGVAWTPDMLQALAVFFAVALLLILIGQWLKGAAVRTAEVGLRSIRKRTVVLLSLAFCAAALRLAVTWAEQPSPLTSLDRRDLITTFELDTRQYLDLDRQMESLVHGLEASTLFLPDAPRRGLRADEEDLLRESWKSFYDCAFALDQVRVFYEDWYRFDPSRAERAWLLRSYLLTFASELALYEKGLRLSRLVLRNDEVETFLDAPHPDAEVAEQSLPEHTFSRFRQELLGTRDQARVVAGEAYLDWLDRTFNARRQAREQGLEPLWSSIDQHLREIHELSTLERAVQTVRADLQVVTRTVRRSWYPTQKRVAEWMGDTRTRRPGRYLIRREQQAPLERALEPGDILLSRKNWYLSNLGLPGFWPHAILYVGAPEELESRLDSPEVRAWLAAATGEEQDLPTYLRRAFPEAWVRYRAGGEDGPFVVIEAVGEGVIFNTLEGAAGDYLAALRPRLGPAAKARAIAEAFRHLDKPYDFDFDFATDHALVCTEVVWRCYRGSTTNDGLRLPLVEVAGRLTLPANEIARIFAEEHGRPDRQLDFVYFLDAREREQIAVVADESAFLRSHGRFKWDLFQK